jgi:DnaK suppressor protein
MIRKASVDDRRRHLVLSRMLTDRQTEIQNKLRAIRESVPAGQIDVKDAEEQSVGDFVRDMDFALVEMECATLRRIDEALQRLEEGSYGVCADCGERIAEARLKALPFAVMCRDCQEHEEQLLERGGLGRHALDEGFSDTGRRKRGEGGRGWTASSSPVGLSVADRTITRLTR